MLLLDEPSAGLSPALQDEVFIRCRQINETGVSIVMVEQNARRCLQICHRAYVLDQGRNAYTGTGDELLTDPKVIELYLGTLARRRADGERGPRNADGPPPARGPLQSLADSSRLTCRRRTARRGVADVAVDQ